MSKSSPSQKVSQSQLLLRQIRNLLTNEHSQIREDNISQEKVQQCLEQSYERLSVLRQFQGDSNKNDPHLLYSKITEASRLIQNQNPMIQKYIRNKIESQIFKSHNQTFIPSSLIKGQGNNESLQYVQEYENLLIAKRQLQEKYLQQRLQKQKTIQQMIKKTKKYSSYQNVKQIVPLMQVQSLISREGADYDSMIKGESRISSKHNLIQPSEDKRKINRQSHRNKGNKNMKKSERQERENFIINAQQEQNNLQDGQAGKILSKNMRKYLNFDKKQSKQKIQVEFEEDETSYIETKSKIKENKITSLLARTPNFMYCFKGFLEQIINLNDDGSFIDKNATDFSFDGKDHQIQPDKKKRFTYPKRENQNTRKLNAFVKNVVENANTNVSSLSLQFKTKGISLLPKQPIQELNNRSNILLMGSSGKIKKVISKRIGETNKYHLKQCIISGSFLYYSDEQSSNIGSSKSNNPLDFVSVILELQKMKKIQITLDPIETMFVKKEQGNIFQGKQSQVEVIAIKSPDRNFYFEKNHAEGIQLMEVLLELKLRRFHKISCLLGARANKNMQQFIEADKGTLDFSHQYLRPIQQYHKEIYRKNFLTMLLSLFPKRPNTVNLQFENCKLGLSELSKIIAESSLYFTKILKLNFSKTKLDGAILSDILKFVKKCPNSSTISLSLCSCGIDNDILISNMVNLSAVVNKIKSLDLSKNPEISDKGIEQLVDCLSSKICQIQSLDISETGIHHFLSIANLLRNCSKLQIVKINNCGLRCQDLSKIQEQFIQYVEKNQLPNKKIVIQMKRNQVIKSIKEIDLLLRNGVHEFELDLDLSFSSVGRKRGKGLVSKHVCIEFVL